MYLNCLWKQGRGKLLINDDINFSYLYDVNKTFLITLFPSTIQDRVRMARRSRAEAPQAGKDEVISGCHNKNNLIP